MSEVTNLIRGIRDLTVRAENAIFYLRKFERSLGTKMELCYIIWLEYVKHSNTGIKLNEL